jgi:hypothetical protein
MSETNHQMRAILKTRILRHLRGSFHRRPGATRVALGLRDTIYFLRGATTWLGYVGRGPKAERAAGLVNRAGFALDNVLYDVETELWALAKLDDQEYTTWLTGS